MCDKGCCRWMLAASFRSCFGPCFKRLGHPHGYDSIDDSVEDIHRAANGLSYENGYRNIGGASEKSKLDYRSKSTSEIFRSNDYFLSNGMKPDKRSFSASFGYLDETGMWECYSDEELAQSARNSTNDLRSDVSEAFWSCRGSVSRSSIPTSEQDFYSDDSEEPRQLSCDDDMPEDDRISESAPAGPVCEGCGEIGKHHEINDLDRCNWREKSLNSSLPIPKSGKWIQME